ncbi:MAG: efflux RND transporter periplasmic adaptor subunit [Hyphomicrobium sp.]
MKAVKTALTLAAAAALGVSAYKLDPAKYFHTPTTALTATPAESVVKAPSVSVVRVTANDFAETVLVTGSLVAREEILVAPEVEGLKVVEIKVDQGDRVKKGDILAKLVSETLDSLVAQNDASLARNTAAIAQARSQIVEAEARVKEAKNSLARAKPLNKEGYLSGSTYDQRESAANTSQAQLVAARDGLKAAEAARAEVEARGRELTWRRSNAEVRAPASGLISRRGARLGAIASSAGTGAGEPLFRIIQDGEIELDAEVTESQIPKLLAGQAAIVKVAGGIEAAGKLRLISPEIDPATRLGRVRIFLGDNPSLKTGAFGSGIIETAVSHGLALPVTAISTAGDQSTVLAVVNGRVQRRTVTTGLTAGGLVEIKSGLAEGDQVIARAGSFLRDGDAVRAISIDGDDNGNNVSTGISDPRTASEVQ